VASLLVLLALQSDPTIERVERLAGPVQRPLRWAPLAVELHAPAAWSGDVVARSGFGFSFARRVSLAAGARQRVLLPSLDPQTVEAGKSSARVPRPSVRADKVVGVDSRLPYASELVAREGVLFVLLPAEDLRPLLAQGLLDALDVILVAEPAGPGPSVVAADRDAAERAIAALGRPPERIEAVDVGAWALAPEGGWVPAKRTAALYFAAVYGLAGFAALVTLARRSARWAAGTVAGLAVLGGTGYVALFPRGQLWVQESSCEVVPPAGDARVWRLWFVGAATDLTTSIELPSLAKPVFSQSAGAEEPFTIRVDEGAGCRVEDLHLPSGRAACFASVESRPPSQRASQRIVAPIYRASVLIENRNRDVGDLLPGTSVPREVPEDGPAPLDPEFQVFRRFIATDAVFGRLDASDGPAQGVRSPDLTDPRARPRYYVERFR
jgi:hypothetical protein